jgi:hypothetical protein
MHRIPVSLCVFKNGASIGSQDSQNSSPNSIFSFIQEKLVVWHFCKIQTDIASENFIEKTTLLKDIK